MPYISIEGSRYFYGESYPEKGKPAHTIVFVHGAGGNHKQWQGQLAYLGRKHRVLAVDLPGHGLSAGRPSDTIEGYSRFIRDFANDLIGGPFFLGGHSMGGAVTLRFAGLYPEMLRGMILVGTGARLRVPTSILDTFKRGEYFTELIPMLYGEDGSPGNIRAAEEEMLATPTGTWHADFTACDHFDITAELGGIQVPALVVSATGDRMTPVKYGQFLESRLPKAKLAVIEGVGHMITVEKPGELNLAVENFVEEI